MTAVVRHMLASYPDGRLSKRDALGAAALHMSPRTVEHHLRMAYRKLGVRSRTEMTRHPAIRRHTNSTT
jgi:hypothetical protein